MRHDNLLKVTSSLSVVLFSLHVADDIVRGFEEGRLSNLPAVLIFTVWLYGAFVLTGRGPGYVIQLLGGALSLAVPVLHLMGKGVGGAFAGSAGALFFIWTIFALGTTGLFSAVLAAHGLWSVRRPRASRIPQASQ